MEILFQGLEESTHQREAITVPPARRGPTSDGGFVRAVRAARRRGSRLSWADSSGSRKSVCTRARLPRTGARPYCSRDAKTTSGNRHGRIAGHRSGFGRGLPQTRIPRRCDVAIDRTFQRRACVGDRGRHPGPRNGAKGRRGGERALRARRHAGQQRRRVRRQAVRRVHARGLRRGGRDQRQRALSHHPGRSCGAARQASSRRRCTRRPRTTLWPS